MNTTETPVQAVPKRKVRWVLWSFVTVAALFVIWLGYQHRSRPEMERKLASLRSQGYATSLAELSAKLKHVPAEQNLSLVVLDVAALLDNGWKSAKDGIEEPPRGEPSSPEALKKLRNFVTNNVEAFERTAEILRRTEGIADVDYSKGFMMLLPHIGTFKEVANAYASKARLAAEERRPHDAAQDILAILQVSRGLEEEPELLAQLVRYAVVGIGCRSMDRALNLVEFSAADLQTLQEAFARVGGVRRMDVALSVELAAGLDVFVNRPGQLFTTGVMDVQVSSVARFVLNTYAGLGFLKSEAATHVRMLSEMIEIARRPTWEQHKPLKEWESGLQQLRAHPRPGSLLSPMLLPALINASQKEGANFAIVNCTVAALAIERYKLAHEKRLPETLEALVPEFLKAVPVDVFDGKPLRFQRVDHGWQVYSIGPDLKDNHGFERVKQQRDDHYDIGFTVER